jgi:hypothetical protein
MDVVLIDQGNLRAEYVYETATDTERKTGEPLPKRSEGA